MRSQGHYDFAYTPLVFSRALVDLQCQLRENRARNPRLDAFKSGGLVRLLPAKWSPGMICDRERVRHTPPGNLADSLYRGFECRASDFEFPLRAGVCVRLRETTFRNSRLLNDFGRQKVTSQ